MAGIDIECISKHSFCLKVILNALHTFSLSNASLMGLLVRLGGVAGLLEEVASAIGTCGGPKNSTV